MIEAEKITTTPEVATAEAASTTDEIDRRNLSINVQDSFGMTKQALNSSNQP